MPHKGQHWSEEAKLKIGQASLGRRRPDSPRSWIKAQIGHEPKSNSGYVYRIIRVSDGETIWIGATRQPELRCRASQHKSTEGEGPVRFEILEETEIFLTSQRRRKVPDARLNAAEQYWIALFRHAEAPLKNQTKGGWGNAGIRWPKEVIQKRIAPLIGKPRPPEVVEKMRAAWTAEKREKAKIDGARSHMGKNPVLNNQDTHNATN